MKVSALQENFSKGLSVVGRAVPARSTLPQASHVKIETDEGRLKLVATDLMMATTCWIGAQVEEEGAVTVPARLLTDFVTSLPNESIDLTVPDRGRRCTSAALATKRRWRGWTRRTSRLCRRWPTDSR